MKNHEIVHANNKCSDDFLRKKRQLKVRLLKEMKEKSSWAWRFLISKGDVFNSSEYNGFPLDDSIQHSFLPSW